MVLCSSAHRSEHPLVLPQSSFESPALTGATLTLWTPAAKSFSLLLQHREPPHPNLVFPIHSRKAGKQNSQPSFSCLIPQPGLFPKAADGWKTIVFSQHWWSGGICTVELLDKPRSREEWEEGWVGRCSASQAGRIALAVALWSFHSVSPGRELFSHSRLLPSTREGGREDKAEGSRHTDSTQLPNCRLISAAGRPWGRGSLPLQALHFWFKIFTPFLRGQWRNTTSPNSTRQWITELGSFCWS